ncbi:MAG TPA: hypothetical protein VFA85_05250 [Terriglobales bacterium]|nr:hypothetical protein [Candidatus Binataceae bacterium]HZR64533.1 hypothetical protein [Terriglobales bacterium]
MRTLSLTLSFLICAFALAAVPAANAQGFVPVTSQSLNLGSMGPGTLTAIKITNVGVVGGKLVATGLATVNTATGTAVGVFTNQPLAASTQASSNSCPILHLVLGPIHLNLLGLTVTTNQIVLDITAVPGAGNLLGNLLCAVANLLNQTPAPLSEVGALLTQILNSL